MVIKLGVLFLFVWGVVSCGGGSKQEGSHGKYEVDSYMSAQVSDSNMTGTWVFLLDFDMEYRDEGFHSDSEHRRYVNKSRQLVHIIDSGDELELIYQAGSGTSYRREYMSRYEGGIIRLDMDRGYFIGELTDNNFITGDLRSIDEDKEGGYVIFHHGSGSMIKISSVLGLPGTVDSPSIWGSIAQVLDYELESVDRGQVDGEAEIPIHLFEETELTWQRYEDGDLECTDELHRVYALNFAEPFEDDRRWPANEYVLLENIVRGECYESYPAGWHYAVGSDGATLGFQRTLEATTYESDNFELSEELIYLSEPSMIIGGFQRSEGNLVNQNIDVNINLDAH